MSPGRLALHSTGLRLAGHRVLEHERREVRGRRLLAAGGQRDRPVDREPRVVVLRRDGEQLERPGSWPCSSSRSTPARCRRRSRAPGSSGRSSLNSGSAPTSDGPKSDTMTSIFGYLAIAAVSTFWVSAGSQFVTSNGCSPMNLYLPEGSRILCSPLFSSTPWLLPLRAAEEEDVAAVRQDLEDPLAPVLAAWAKAVSTNTL